MYACIQIAREIEKGELTMFSAEQNGSCPARDNSASDRNAGLQTKARMEPGASSRHLAGEPMKCTRRFQSFRTVRLAAFLIMSGVIVQLPAQQGPGQPLQQSQLRISFPQYPSPSETIQLTQKINQLQAEVRQIENEIFELQKERTRLEMENKHQEAMLIAQAISELEGVKQAKNDEINRLQEELRGPSQPSLPTLPAPKLPPTNR
jgi:DNA repair exonuclease SbcCD ATPase subunit